MVISTCLNKHWAGLSLSLRASLGYDMSLIQQLQDNAELIFDAHVNKYTKMPGASDCRGPTENVEPQEKRAEPCCCSGHEPKVAASCISTPMNGFSGVVGGLGDSCGLAGPSVSTKRKYLLVI